jgi:hypothetical protein
MEEVGGDPGAAGTVCIVDSGLDANGNAYDEWAEIRFSRKGAAPPDQRAFLSGANYEFGAGGAFNLGADILDDSTFQLSKLGKPITLDPARGARLFQQIDDHDTNQTLESCSGTLSGTLQLTP